MTPFPGPHINLLRTSPDAQVVTFPDPLAHELRTGADVVMRYACARPLDEIAGLLGGTASLMRDAADAIEALSK